MTKLGSSAASFSLPSGKAVLIYDAKCALCTNLAHKAYFNARKSMEIWALSDPKAISLLNQAYPDGWERNFYVIDRRGCSKGVRSLYKLLDHVGARQLTALLSEYASVKVAAKRSMLLAGTSRRRRVSKPLFGVALGALAVQLAGMTKIANPKLSQNVPIPHAVINFAEARPNGGTRANVHVYRATDAMRRTTIPPLRARPADREARITRSDEQTLQEVEVPNIGSLLIDTATITKESAIDGERSMVTYSVALDAPRYNIAFYVGYGDVETPEGITQAATLSAGIRHDLAMPLADVVTLVDGKDQGVAEHLKAYRSSLGELRTLHVQEGRDELGQLYDMIDIGMARLEEAVVEALPVSYTPIKNRLLISSMPEVLRLVDFPRPFTSEVITGCGCSCSCGCCCGVSCGIGVCIPPRPCGPGCCCSCSCGCGCCL
ncbi:MAG: hypothetical protein ACRDTH_02735 [Pseudonocardiaceae bacterium]